MKLLVPAISALTLTSAYVFLLLPIAIVIVVSFSTSAVFNLPTDGFSLRWYFRLMSLNAVWSSFANSVVIAFAAASISLLASGAACFALAFYRPVWARTVIALCSAPLLFPGLVLGIALLQFFVLVNMRTPMIMLLLGHTVVTIPFFIRALLPAFMSYEFSIYQAALCLGAPPITAVRKAVLPVVAPGVVGGYLFAYFASFENYSVSLFLSDVRVKTLPVQMLQYIEESTDPSLAALSVVIILKTLVLLAIVDRVFGIREV